MIRPCALAVTIAFLAVGCAGFAPSSNDATARSDAAENETLQSESVEREIQEITLRVRNKSCVGLGIGSGFAVDDYHLVTNHHVAAGADEIEISTWDGHTIDAQAVAATRISDIAVIEVDTALPRIADHAFTKPSVGDDVIAVGFPRGGEMQLSEGTIRSIEHDAYLGELLRTDATIRQGNSGGPLVNRAGDVVGVVVAIDTRSGEGLAISNDAISDAATHGLTSIQTCF